MRRKRAKQLLLFALGASPKKKKKRRRRREVTFGQLTRDDVDFDSLDAADQNYVRAVIESRKRAIQARWSAQEELERRLGHTARNRKQFARTDDGRLVEGVFVVSPISLGESDDSGED